MKRTITFAAALIVLLGFAAPLRASADAAVSGAVCGAALTGSASPVLRGGTAYVPLRGFADALSLSISWDSKTATATVSGRGVTLSVSKYTPYIISNGVYFYMPSGVLMSDGRLTLPARVLAAAYGLTASWDHSARTVLLTGSVTPPSVSYNSDAVYWLSRIINAEAEGEPLAGKIAVSNVVLNRAASADYPNTIYGVIFDRKYGVQFEPTVDGRIRLSPNTESVAASKLCLNGASVVGKSLYFLNPNKADSTWFVKNLRYVATIGAHAFYAEA